MVLRGRIDIWELSRTRDLEYMAMIDLPELPLHEYERLKYGSLFYQ
jgi:hypothetical protein